jgi:hypothetical protein
VDRALQALGARAVVRGRQILLPEAHPSFDLLLHEAVHLLQVRRGTGDTLSGVAGEHSLPEQEAARVGAHLQSSGQRAAPLPCPDIAAGLGARTLALQRVDTLERPRTRGIESWVVAPESSVAVAPIPEAQHPEPVPEVRPEVQSPEQAQSAPASDVVAVDPQAVQLPAATAPQIAPAAGAAQAVVQPGGGSQAAASLASYQDVPGKLQAFSAAPPSVKAQHAAALGQDVNRLAGDEAASLQQSLPELHARLESQVEPAPALRVAAPAAAVVQLEATPPPPAPDAEVSPSQDLGHYVANDSLGRRIEGVFQAGSPDRSAGVNQSLRSVQTTDPSLATSPGPVPQVPLTGENDPQRLDTQSRAGLGQAAQASQAARQAVLDGPGAEQVQPLHLDEGYSVGEIARPAIQPGEAPPGAQAYLAMNLPADVQAAFDQQQAPGMQSSLDAARGRVDQAVAEREQGRQAEVTRAQQQADQLSSQADEQQRQQVQRARQGIQDERQSALNQQNQAVQDLQRDVNTRRQEDRQAITGRAREDQQRVGQRYDQAERQAQDEVRSGERRAEAERQRAERQASEQSWWDRAVHFVKDAFNALTRAIGAIFDAVRAAVNRVLDAAKAFALAVIDAAASFVKRAIAAFGNFLKSAVDALLGQVFPGLAAALNAAIDRAVTVAQSAVNAVANGLKAGISALIEGLRAGINAVITLYQSALQFALDLVQAAFTGDWSALARKVLEAVLGVLGISPADFYAFIGRAEETFQIILDRPGAFVGHLVDAFLSGVRRFADNFLTHLQAGIIGWLTGALGGAGITLPERFDLMGVLSLVQQIIGLTWQRLRQRAVRLIGERAVAVLEFAYSYIETLMQGGWQALFERIQQDLTGLKDMILDRIKSFLLERIVMAAITRLATLFNPVGALVQLVMAAWNVYTFLRDQLQRIIQVVRTVVDAIGDIARGVIAPAAQRVEGVLASLLPLAIDLLARFLGLGGIGEKVREIVTRIQALVDRAIDSLLERVRGMFRGGAQSQTAAAQPAAARAGAPALSPQAATKLKNDALGAARRRLAQRKLRSLDDLRGVLSGVHREFAPRGLRHMGFQVTNEASLAANIYASASEPERLSVQWADIFEKSDEKKKVFETQPRNETNAAISVNGKRVGEVAKSEKGRHAEDNLLAAHWKQTLDLARESVKQGKETTVAVAINRAPCHNLCSPLLTNTLQAVEPDLKRQVRFILAPTGLYEPSESLTAEEIEKDRKELEAVAERQGVPAEPLVRQGLAKARRTEDTTTMNDLRRLTAAGWDIRQLQAKPKLTTSGQILAEVAHRLAVEAGRIKVGSG